MGLDSKSISKVFESSFATAFQHLDQGWKAFVADFTMSFLQALAKIEAEFLAKQFAKALFGSAGGGGKGGILSSIIGFIGGALGGLFGGAHVGGRATSPAPAFHALANGGIYGAYTPRIVGERGVEVDIPSSGGRVISNADLRRMLGASSDDSKRVHVGAIHVHINAPHGANPNQLTLPARAAAKEIADYLNHHLAH
jgi:hypothetical protein